MAPPARFEAGTQPVAQVVAAGVAAEWLMNIGMENLEAHERVIAGELLKMGQIDGVRILGPQTNEQRIGTVAFEIDGVHRMMLDSSSMRRHRHSCRTSLRTAGPPSLRRVRIQPRIQWHLQFRRRRAGTG